MQKKTFLGFVGAFIAMVTLLAGCAGSSSITTANVSADGATTPAGVAMPTGTLQVNITDAPAKPEIEQVWLTVAGVKIHLAGNGVEPTTTTSITTQTTTNQTESDAGWKSLTLVGDTRFNLLELQGGLQSKLAETDLVPGKYTQVRMDVTLVEIKLKGDDKLKVAILPSGSLKFVQPFDIIAGRVTIITFDFDALKSINQTGNGEYKCKPVIKLAATYPTLKFDTGITSDSVSLPGTLASGFTITTGGVANTMHPIGLTGTVATPALADGQYAFTLQATPEQKTALTSYFAAKGGWTTDMQTQIGKEINGSQPFLYLKAAGGVYSLVDNFKLWLGLTYSPYPLTIDDDYPVGTYVYTGTLTGTNGATLPVTVTLVLSRIP